MNKFWKIVGIYVDRKNKIIYFNGMMGANNIIFTIIGMLATFSCIVGSPITLISMVLIVPYMFANAAIFEPERQLYREMINYKWPGQYKHLFIDERIVASAPALLLIILETLILLLFYILFDIRLSRYIFFTILFTLLPWAASTIALVWYNHIFDKFCEEKNLKQFQYKYLKYEEKDCEIVSTLVRNLFILLISFSIFFAAGMLFYQPK